MKKQQKTYVYCGFCGVVSDACDEVEDDVCPRCGEGCCLDAPCVAAKLPKGLFEWEMPAEAWAEVTA